jgi:hypothetical protein
MKTLFLVCILGLLIGAFLSSYEGNTQKAIGDVLLAILWQLFRIELTIENKK